ncbi:MAG: Tex-like N-terminal domain-containing protein, partial [Planctomycetota bacterium]
MSENQLLDLEATYREIANSIEGASPKQVKSTVELLDAGNTLPFIARYRKEATSNLDEIQLRAVQDGITKCRELAKRKSAILKSIKEQGKLTDDLKSRIETCRDRQSLEDIYLPYKQKRRTRATVAREKGLQPLADILLRQERLGKPRKTVLQDYVSKDKGVATTDEALQGALDIVAESWAEDADARTWLAEKSEQGKVVSRVKRGKKTEGSKFELYFDHQES